MTKAEKLWVITKAATELDPAANLFEIRNRIEWALITEALRQARGNAAAAARKLGIGRTTLAMKLAARDRANAQHAADHATWTDPGAEART